MSDYKTLRLAFLLYWWSRKDNPTEHMKALGLCQLFQMFIRDQNLVAYRSTDYYSHLFAFTSEFRNFPNKNVPFDVSLVHYHRDPQKHLNLHRRAWVEAQLRDLGLI